VFDDVVSALEDIDGEYQISTTFCSEFEPALASRIHSA
jgi:hypothetical protein